MKTILLFLSLGFSLNVISAPVPARWIGHQENWQIDNPGVSVDDFSCANAESMAKSILTQLGARNIQTSCFNVDQLQLNVQFQSLLPAPSKTTGTVPAVDKMVTLTGFTSCYLLQALEPTLSLDFQISDEQGLQCLSPDDSFDQSVLVLFPQ